MTADRWSSTSTTPEAPAPEISGFRGGRVVIIGQLFKLALQISGVVILARLLSPEDFGLVAMVAVFMALGDLIRDFGMPTAALQARTLSHQQASNAFWANAVLGSCAAVLLVLAAPGLVALYDEPRLTNIAWLMAFALLLNGAQAQVQVQLARSGRFAALALTDVAAQSLGLTCAILAATVGDLGYWSLVVQLLVSTMLLLTLRLIVARWLPTAPRRGHGSRALLLAGGQVGIAQFLTYAANNVDTMVIGARWGATDLGYYNRAFQLFVLPRVGILEPLTQVVLPTANRAIDQRRNPFELLFHVQLVLSTAICWIYMSGAVVAPWVIPTTLGEEWMRSVDLFCILAVAGCFSVFGTVSFWLFLVSGNTKQLLYLHFVTKPLVVFSILLAAPYGIEAVALAYSLSMALNWPVNLIWLSRCSDLSVWRNLRSGGHILLSAAAAYAVARAVGDTLGDPESLPGVLGGAAAAGLAYLGLLAPSRSWRAGMGQARRQLKAPGQA